jgi:glycosyltransferase involved in cell wall biosynthesis
MPAMSSTVGEKPVNDPCLTVIPSVPVWRHGADWVFDRKFYDGLLRYTRAWPGRVRCLAWRASTGEPGFGSVAARRDALPFEVELLEEGDAVSRQHLAGSTMVMASADDHRQLGIAFLCKRLGIPCAYVIEYVPETRHQINQLEAPNRWVRWRRDWFLKGRERARRAAFRACSGLQANGVPAYEAYRHARNPLLYFDTRVRRAQLIAVEALEARLLTLRENRPLRLAFSGRLIAMKGADHLVEAAHRLRERGVRAEWTLYGSGEMEASLRARVHRLGLSEVVRLPGAVDFEAALLPAIQSRCDLYVMLHRQSDPSCTYLETLACGIPIVGYDNQAFRGLLSLTGVGVGVALDDIDGVVEAIAHLDRHRCDIARMSHQARAFAAGHSFEDTFQRRVDHLLSLTGRP